MIPWCHIIANEKFGTLVTEDMGGYTWHKNSRLNRISSWHNLAFLDIPSEIIYMEDLKTNKKWTLGLNPMPDENDYNIIYGFGYAKYIHESQGILQELETFVPENDSIKINILKLTNKKENARITSFEIGLPITKNNLNLPCGITGRIEYE